MKKAVALRATAFFVKFKKLFNNELCVCVCKLPLYKGFRGVL